MNFLTLIIGSLTEASLTSKIMKLIINADDFGYSSNVNRAIEKALKSGLISSTSILVNMPGFDEAVTMAKNESFIGRVGIHLNLFEGKPLTKEMQKCSLFCDENGIFHGKIDENGIYQGKKLGIFAPLKIKSSIIFNELAAQIDKAINAGILPTHLDSHGQIHTNYFIGRIVIKLAKKYNITSIRINSNVYKRKRKISPIMVRLYNLRLKMHGIKCVNYLGNIPTIALALNKLSGIVEVIVHPGYRNGILVDFEWDEEFTHLLAPFLDFEKINYAEL